ncbi:MAG TPA: pyrrolo-quinoline quinone [Rhodospirillaceae bacterium]|nr:pyrrolo-quinoline quinone [Rhodospirillaceae bacterium]HAA92909.1 pyrrolo-quinoline quinone [Rhodospirillaceae bacterium]HAT34343.1 pyrrolo-quinoline quinone [Rhodospirillaceae bacterium]
MVVSIFRRQARRRRFGNALIAVAVIGLAGCDTFDNIIGKKDAPPLPGERIPIMLHERDRDPDPRVSDLRVLLPPPRANRDWAQSGGRAAHAMHHLKIGKAISARWSANVGQGSEDDRRLLASPIIVGERVFVADLESNVSAINARTGERVWRFRPKVPDEDDEAFGGGLAFEDGTVFLSTGFGRVYALDGATGKLKWMKKLSGPMRAPPSVSNGRVFVVTIDNQLIALNTKTGDRLWSHAGLSETAGLLGGAAPAIDGTTVVVPYSSGEIFAVRAENGRVAWSEALSPVRRIDALATLAHVRGSPVIDRGLVYAISHSGRLVAIDRRSGARIWERNIGGVETPWVAGNFLYVLSNESEIYCLTRRGGRIRWVRPLPKFENPRDKEGPIKWSGPVLVGDRLVVTGSHGEALSISPYTGEPLGRVELPSRISIAPVVAGETLYFYTDEAELIAYR